MTIKLFCVLNWGIGHATRSVFIIKKLLKNNVSIIIASDGMAYELLKKEFPDLPILELPSYKISYSKKGGLLKWKLLFSIPKIARAVINENKLIKQWITQYGIDAIVSDNRLGCYSNKIPSIYITHQINVLTGFTTKLSSWVHQYFIKKYDQCWVPDYKTEPSLAGKMSHTTNKKMKLIYIGILSELKKIKKEPQYDLLIVLSGPEPQRTLLEKKLKIELKRFEGSVLFVRGIIDAQQEIETLNNVTYYNYMTRNQIALAYNVSKTILCRSGYSSIMDLAKLEKKAFFIPTPGQAEQRYLACKLAQEGIAPYATQDLFKIEDLKKIANYTGWTNKVSDTNWEKIFTVFKK